MGGDQTIRNHPDIELYAEGSEKEIEIISNYLITNNFPYKEINDEQIEVLESTILLSKYSSWDTSHLFDIHNNNLVFFPRVMSYSNSNDFQIMFWLKTNNIKGHYYFRKKTGIEKIIDIMRNDDEFKFKDFEIFTIKSSIYRTQILSVLKTFQDIKNIEIEIHNDNLYIKTVDAPTLDNFKILFKQIKTL